MVLRLRQINSNTCIQLEGSKWGQTGGTIFLQSSYLPPPVLSAHTDICLHFITLLLTNTNTLSSGSTQAQHCMAESRAHVLIED